MEYEVLKDAQKIAIDFLERSYKNSRLSHAYIFEGHAGTMKLEAALFFASMLLCTDKESHLPCGTCNNCMRVAHTTHPNLHIVEPSKKQIVKEDIRALQHDFNRTALEEGPKIYIINHANKLNAHAANALLKFLEEPHEDIYGILITDDTSHLLPTLVSRSQIVPFHPLPESSIEQALLDLGYEQSASRLASRLKNTIEEAQEYLEDENIHDIIEAVGEVYETLLSEGTALTAFEESLEAVLNYDAEKVLDVFIHYQKDLIYGKINNQGDVVFAESAEITKSLSERYELNDLLTLLQRFMSVKASLAYYINIRLALDNVMLELERRLADGK